MGANGWEAEQLSPAVGYTNQTAIMKSLLFLHVMTVMTLASFGVSEANDFQTKDRKTTHTFVRVDTLA